MIFWIEFKSATRKTHNVYKAFHSKLSILSIVIVLIRTENTTPDSRGYARPSTLNLSCMMRSYITTVIIISIRSSYRHCVTYRNHMHPPEDVQPSLIRNWAFFWLTTQLFFQIACVSLCSSARPMPNQDPHLTCFMEKCSLCAVTFHASRETHWALEGNLEAPSLCKTTPSWLPRLFGAPATC